MPFDTSNAHYGVCDRPLSRETHIRLALNCIYKAQHMRLGWLCGQQLGEAADHLEAAGLDDLAQRCLDEVSMPGEFDAIERDVRAAFERETGR